MASRPPWLKTTIMSVIGMITRTAMITPVVRRCRSTTNRVSSTSPRAMSRMPFTGKYPAAVPVGHGSMPNPAAAPAPSNRNREPKVSGKIPSRTVRTVVKRRMVELL